MKKDFVIGTILFLVILLMISPAVHAAEYETTNENSIALTADFTEYQENYPTENNNGKVFPFGAVIMLCFVSAAVALGKKHDKNT